MVDFVRRVSNVYGYFGMRTSTHLWWCWGSLCFARYITSPSDKAILWPGVPPWFCGGWFLAAGWWFSILAGCWWAVGFAIAVWRAGHELDEVPAVANAIAGCFYGWDQIVRSSAPRSYHLYSLLPPFPLLNLPSPPRSPLQGSRSVSWTCRIGIWAIHFAFIVGAISNVAVLAYPQSLLSALFGLVILFKTLDNYCLPPLTFLLGLFTFA